MSPSQTPAPPAPRPVGAPAILTVTDLTVRRGARLLLDRVTFTVPQGTLLAIVGPNGAGKTTLLRALLGSQEHEGEVRWSGSVRVGYVPQKLVDTDIPLTVEEFLAMKCPGAYGTCLATVGLDPRLLDETIGTLSGGELQRVLIAWAIVDDPQVLLFDEPTSNVDLGSEEVILETLHEVQRRTRVTLLLVTHDLHAVHHFADRVLALDGRVLYDGSPGGLLEDPELVRRVFGTTHPAHRHDGVEEASR